MKSIRRFLVVSLLLSVVTIAGIAVLRSFQDATHQVDELFDAELAQMARVLQSLLAIQLKRTHLDTLRDSLSYKSFEEIAPLSEGEDEEENEATEFGHKYERKLAFVVWNTHGEELLNSLPSGKHFPLTEHSGYGKEQLQGYTWRSFTLHDRSMELWIKVAQRIDVRQELTEEIVQNSFWPMVLMVPMMGLVIWLVVRWGLSPLWSISRQITSRGQHDLTPLDTDRVPDEVVGVVNSVNALLGNLQEALNRERQFTADAAHELRTPLAGIRIHAQNLLAQLERSSRTEKRRSGEKSDISSKTPNQILSGVDQMTHVVEQLLTLSRLEYRQESQKAKINLTVLLRTIVAGLVPLALAREQEIDLIADENLYIEGVETGLEALCRNLIDNAIRYTPQGGKISIDLHEVGVTIELVVADTGPGIDVSERDKVFQRFYRLAEQQISGSGLGLAIVKQVAEQHGGTVTLDRSELSETGLAVRVVFPN